MSQEIPLPPLTDDGEIVVAVWLKRPGDHVEVGEVIAEVVTDKVNVEIEAPVAGLLEAILADEGAVVVPGQPIARIGDG